MLSKRCLRSCKVPRSPLGRYLNDVWSVSCRKNEPHEKTLYRLIARFLTKNQDEMSKLASNTKSSDHVEAKKKLERKLNTIQDEFLYHPFYPSLIKDILNFPSQDSELNEDGRFRIATRVFHNLCPERKMLYTYISRNVSAQNFPKASHITGKSVYVRLNSKRVISELQCENNSCRVKSRGNSSVREKMHQEVRALLEKRYSTLDKMKKECFEIEAKVIRKYLSANAYNISFERAFRAAFFPMHEICTNDTNHHIGNIVQILRKISLGNKLL